MYICMALSIISARGILYIRDPLPQNHSILKDVMDDTAVKDLQSVYDAIVSRFDYVQIQGTLAFGSLLGQARHSVRMPWDDDLDLMIHERDVSILLKGLPRYSKKVPWCRKPSACKKYRGPTCCSWQLKNDIFLTWKPWGMPFKVTTIKGGYPGIDINTYTNQSNKVMISDHQLKSGHVKHFSVPSTSFFPLVKKSFMFRDIYVPNNVDAVLSSLWGPQWATNCIITYNHRQSRVFYARDFPGLENPNANKHTKVSMPCKYLPLSLHGEYLK